MHDEWFTESNVPSVDRLLGLERQVQITTSRLPRSSGKAKNKDAERGRQYREKLAQKGLKQVNVITDEPTSEVIKELAKSSKAGEGLYQILVQLAWKHCPKDLLPRKKSQSEIDKEKRMLQLGQRVYGLSGWRRWLVRFALRY